MCEVVRGLVEYQVEQHELQGFPDISILRNALGGSIFLLDLCPVLARLAGTQLIKWEWRVGRLQGRSLARWCWLLHIIWDEVAGACISQADHPVTVCLKTNSTQPLLLCNQQCLPVADEHLEQILAHLVRHPLEPRP